MKENIQQSALNKLLKILSNHTNANLPRDARTLLKTCRTVFVKKLDNSGDIFYIGITLYYIVIYKLKENIMVT